MTHHMDRPAGTPARDVTAAIAHHTDDMADVHVPAASSSAETSASHKRKGMHDEQTKSNPPASSTKRVKSNSTAVASLAAAMSFALWRPSTWSELTVDFIESITNYLTLPELALVSRLSRAWCGVAGEIQSRRFIVRISRDRVTPLIESDLRRHIVDLTISGANSPFTHEMCKLLQAYMPQLRTLDCRIDCNVGPHDVHHRFPALTALNVGLVTSPVSEASTVDTAWSHIQRAMDDIGRDDTLTTLTILIDDQSADPPRRLSPANMPVDVIRPLLQLRTTLTSLSFRCPNNRGQWQQGHIVLIRCLDRLTDLDLCDGLWDAQELSFLTDDGNDLAPFHLKRINLSQTIIKNDDIPALTRMPTLTTFEPGRIDVADVSFLGSMVQLEIATLICDAEVRLSLLIAAVVHCTRLHNLTIVHPELTDAHLCTLLPSLPHIRSLTIAGEKLSSLTFASTVSHLADTLTSLSLNWCRLPVDALHPLRSLRGLQRLDFYRCFKTSDSTDGVLDELTRASFTPSSPAFLRHFWPRLVNFTCEP
jgi:hypothetical protein